MSDNIKELKINNEDINNILKEIIKIAKFALDDTKNIDNELTRICQKNVKFSTNN